MSDSTEVFLKRLSFFLIYIPSLIYGCQFAYYTGISEPIGVSVSSLGMNYFEVSFLGYLNLSTSLLKNFNSVGYYLVWLLFYLNFALLFLILGIHPSVRKNEVMKIKTFIFKTSLYLPIFKSNLLKKMHSSWVVSIIYFVIFIMTLLLILSFYTKGKNDIISTVNEIKTSKECKYTTGYVSQNNERFRTQPILCGNNKCSGINIDKLEVVTYIPESYSQFLNIPKKYL